MSQPFAKIAGCVLESGIHDNKVDLLLRLLAVTIVVVVRPDHFLRLDNGEHSAMPWWATL